MHSAAIALGSNLGDREQNLLKAIGYLRLLGTVQRVSSFIDTAPVGYTDQPRFLNGALTLETMLEPRALLLELLAIEQRMGRDRERVPAKGPRLIDLDLLLFGNRIVAEEGLTLPHPAMHDRLFVLAPLAEIAPDWVHPQRGMTVAQLLDRLERF